MKSILKLAVLGGAAAVAAYTAIKKISPEILPKKSDFKVSSSDIRIPLWESFVAKYELNMRDIDFLQSISTIKSPYTLNENNCNLTHEELLSYFTLWCFMNIPLGLDMDSAPQDNEMMSQILSNEDLLKVNNDSLEPICKRIKTNLIEDTIIKPLKDNEYAVCFFNKGNESKIFELNLQKVPYEDFISTPVAPAYEVYDLFTKETFDIKDDLLKYVPAHGVRAFRVKVKQ